jgi:integrase/recombinase XerD
MSASLSPFGPHISRLLAHKRALGIGYVREERFLREFGQLTAGWPDAVVSDAVVRHYLAGRSEGARPNRLTVVRALAIFLSLEEPRTFIPPPRFLGIRRHAPVIRVLSRDEARRFLAACDTVPDAVAPPDGLLRGTALRMLLLTGLRRGELVALQDEDVDLAAQVVTVRCGKYGKARVVPIADDLVARLRACRVALGDRAPSDAFFPGPDRRHPLNADLLYRSFRVVLAVAGIPHQGRGRGPRLHDLRHSFAVFRLLAWYESGASLGTKLPLLATYLGHIGLSSTQDYLHMTEDLISPVLRREQVATAAVITEDPS